MKKHLLFMLSAGMFSAQTTITKAFHDPVIGDVVNNVNVNGTVNNSATGNNATFNNTGLTAGTVSVSNYVAPTASEISTFPGTTIKMTGNGSTAYYKATASKLEITGLVTPDATLNFITNNGTYISYPAAFGYSENDTAAGTFTSSSGSGNFTGTIVITADAAGTLLIGSKTYSNVLRIKSVQNLNLTIFGFPVGSVSNTSYAYYDNLHKFPLLNTTTAVVTFQGNPQTTNVAQALSETFLSVSDVNLKEMMSIYPNPAKNFIRMKGDVPEGSVINIYSLEGKIVKTIRYKSGDIDISDLPLSSYFIEVSDSKKTEKTKFIKN
ncbi:MULTISPECIES: T9SS type A sorting domain-containing protein [Chryseobacterium]|uniref:Por secretion system C-terminal sorting domain n=1 Tax=Chryseobacterium taihuense TaxID=1141221 RepID=A0A4U8WDZ2_9FLAO|nr:MULTISPECIES: T9SS type A sorting domain-containing protein [Chryseobacterium]QQV02110.1 T9SS type A sorting domain-containing protein [Chryseobacterium sp. FDAARGOS 1104]VFB04657.1 Por secretion system C-terminal sorting domain [Chryseobacterium taihuense]